MRECLKWTSGDPDSRDGFKPIEVLPNSGMLGDCGMVFEYGGRVPLTRSGERGNSGVPGEAASLVGGSIMINREENVVIERLETCSLPTVLCSSGRRFVVVRTRMGHARKSRTVYLLSLLGAYSELSPLYRTASPYANHMSNIAQEDMIHAIFEWDRYKRVTALTYSL